MKQNKILVLAHLTGKASTDAIYEKVVSTAGELRGFAVSPQGGLVGDPKHIYK